jgi:hypothetical protein
MKALVASVLLLTATLFQNAPAMAGWQKIQAGTNGNTYYFDYKRVVRIGNGVQYWYKIMQPYPDYAGIKSLAYKVEGNCLYNQVRSLEGKVYDQKGKLMATQPMDGQVRYPSYGSYEEYFLKQACGQ